MEATVEPGSGTVLGRRYRLEAPIGRGGSGEVWRATDELLERKVAVKLLRPDVAGNPSMRRLIEREARYAAALTAAGVPALHDIVVDDDLPFVVMELVHGESIADRLRREHPLPLATAVELAAAAADAVEGVHRFGVVHRDVKPENLLIDQDGRVRLADFGIAGHATPEPTITEHASSLGTVQYVAPERIRGAAAAPASDVYSLGVLAYELLAGRRPFDGEPAAELHAHVSALPPPLPDTIPESVRSVLLRALDKDPDRRQASAGMFAEELRRSASSISATPVVAAPPEMAAAAAVTTVLPTRVDATVVLPSSDGSASPLPSRALAVAFGALVGGMVLGVAVLALSGSGDEPTPGKTPVVGSTIASTQPPFDSVPAESEPVPVEETVPVEEPAPVDDGSDDEGPGHGKAKDKKPKPGR